MRLETARVVHHETIRGEYRILRLSVPTIGESARPGQFVHLRVPGLADSMLRRPFSILAAGSGHVEFLYKRVGKGTQAMTRIRVGDDVSLLGPLGNGFPAKEKNTTPVLVAGGYGVAPLLFLARSLPGTGTVFIGGQSSDDILCAREFAEEGWTVLTTTENGTAGETGLVTDALDKWLADQPKDPATEFFGCGPTGMLRAIADRAARRNARAWVSLDRHMGCGVGACLACVVQTCDADGTTTYARVCRDGPIFDARVVNWNMVATE